MKKFMFILFLMVLSTVIYGQVDSTAITPKEVFTFDFNAWVATLTTIAATAVFIGAFIIQVFKVTVKIWKQVIVWLVSIALTVIGNLLNIGFAAEFPWFTTIIYGLAAGLVANGIFDIGTVQGILAFLKLKEKKV